MAMICQKGSSSILKTKSNQQKLAQVQKKQRRNFFYRYVIIVRFVGTGFLEDNFIQILLWEVR